MEQANTKKRARVTSSEKRPQTTTSNPSKRSKCKIEGDHRLDDNNSISSSVDASRKQLGIFEFPWNNTTLIENDKEIDVDDIFYSSLVDGCKAAVGMPGARFSSSQAEILLPSDYELDADCIWSSVLREPLSLRCAQ